VYINVRPLIVLAHRQPANRASSLSLSLQDLAIHVYLRNLRLPAETIMNGFHSISKRTSSSAIVLLTRQVVGDNSFSSFGGLGECDWFERQGRTTSQASRLRARQRMRPSNHESRPVQPQTPRFRDTRVTCRTHKDIDLRACLWLLRPLFLIAGQPCRLWQALCGRYSRYRHSLSRDCISLASNTQHCEYRLWGYTTS
jgi:hypothetical protein